jgi:hypothetical protein
MKSENVYIEKVTNPDLAILKTKVTSIKQTRTVQSSIPSGINYGQATRVYPPYIFYKCEFPTQTKSLYTSSN